jgi:hypothetical protein
MPETVYTAKDWDQVRVAFATSIMVDTSINSLAQNLDAPEWPIKGKEETPAAYIDLDFAEARALLEIKGQSPERIHRLIGILKETLAFDNPFGDMVAQAAEHEKKDNPFLKNLSRLGIKEDYPIRFCVLSADTLEFCRREKIDTLAQFAIFAEQMSQTVIVGGDFRRLLNALANVDEQVLSEILPFRRGTKGLHLPEAAAQALKAPNPAARVQELAVWFKPELEALRADVQVSRDLHRHLVVLGNAATEQAVTPLLAPLVGAPAKEEKKGFLSKLFGR